MKIKKILLYMMTAMLILPLIFAATGCNAKNRHGLDPDNPTKITVWHYYNGAQSIAFDNLVMEFNNTVGAKNGIIVEAVSKSSVDDLIEAVTASAQKKAGAQELPNIFQCYLDTAVNLDDMGILTNLDTYISSEEKSAYVDSYIEEGTFGKEEAFKLFPVAKSTEVLVVNKTAFTPFSDATGVTLNDLSTWEGISETAEKYYTYSNGKSFFGRDAFANYMIIGSLQLGSEIFQVHNGNVTVDIDKNAMKKLWDNYYIPYIKGFFQHTGRFRTDDMKLGNIITAVSSNSGMSYLPSEITDLNGNPTTIDYEVLPNPNFSGRPPYAVQQGASMAVTKSTEAEEYASVEFLKWFTSEKNNIAFSISSGYLPVLKSSNNMEVIESYLADNNIPLSELDRDVLSTAIEQVKSSTLYTSKGFSAGYQARTILNTSMIDLAMADRENILAKIAAGNDKDKVLSAYLSETYFEAWYQKLAEQINHICME